MSAVTPLPAPPIEKDGTGIDPGIDWRELTRRVASGMATAADADPVEQIGLLPQAIRIRNGLAGQHDAMLISFQLELVGRAA